MEPAELAVFDTLWQSKRQVLFWKVKGQLPITCISSGSGDSLARCVHGVTRVGTGGGDAVIYGALDEVVVGGHCDWKRDGGTPVPMCRSMGGIDDE